MKEEIEKFIKSLNISPNYHVFNFKENESQYYLEDVIQKALDYFAPKPVTSEELFKQMNIMVTYVMTTKDKETIENYTHTFVDLAKEYAQSKIDNSAKSEEEIESEASRLDQISVDSGKELEFSYSSFIKGVSFVRGNNIFENNNPLEKPCIKHEGNEIPSKTIVCKHCGIIETTTGFAIKNNLNKPDNKVEPKTRDCKNTYHSRIEINGDECPECGESF